MDHQPTGVDSPQAEQKPAWRNTVGWIAAVLMAVLWLVAGLWKLMNISDFQVKLTQLLVPVSLSLPATLALAITETFAGILLLRPAWRRLGGYLSVVLLVVFMGYVAINYEALRGEDCSCFPWIERAVGPGFFIGDAVMLAIAGLAAVFSPLPSRLRGAVMVLAGITVFGAVSLAVEQFGPGPESDVPQTVRLQSGEMNLHDGRVLIFFFNPTCLHCLDAALNMSEMDWKAEIIGVPTQDFEFSDGFIEDSGLTELQLSPDLDLLKEKFPFEDVPYAVAVDNGRVRERFRFFEEPELSENLRDLGFIN